MYYDPNYGDKLRLGRILTYFDRARFQFKRQTSPSFGRAKRRCGVDGVNLLSYLMYTSLSILHQHNLSLDRGTYIRIVIGTNR